jgi:hypothetical protein
MFRADVRDLLYHRRAADGKRRMKSLDWQRVLLNKDAVILEVNEIFLQRAGWGFVQSALSALGAPHAGGTTAFPPLTSDRAAAGPGPSPSPTPAP